MLINYFPEHTWKKPVVEDSISLLGKNNRMRLRVLLKNLSNTTISHSIEPLTQEIIDWFTPLYTQKISTKNNPKIFDIYGTTLGKNSPYQYYALRLFENDVPVGATIFSERKGILSVAYRIYENDWQAQAPIIQSSPSIYTEYLINAYAYSKNFTTLSHGRDRNPYGINSHIGLAIFKLSIGCSPYLQKTTPVLEQFNTDLATTDILIFEAPAQERKINKGYLICSEEAFPKYMQTTKYSDRIMVETIFRSV